MAQKPPPTLRAPVSAAGQGQSPGAVPRPRGPALAPPATFATHNWLHRVPTPRRPLETCPLQRNRGPLSQGCNCMSGVGGSHCLAGPPSCLLSGWCPPMAPSPRSDCPPHSRSSHRVGVCSSAPRGEHAAGTPQTPLNATGVLNRSAHEMPNVTAEAERGQRPHELPRSPTLSTNVAT